MDALSRFIAKVAIPEDPDGCWEWTAAKLPTGYGLLGSGGKRWLAHRFSYDSLVAPIPKGVVVCHHCDNPSCVNPNHLFLGTQQANMADMWKKGRAVRSKGEANGRSKLTEDQVLAIRQSTSSQRAIAREFGISCTAVCQIRTGKTWKHV